MVCQEAERVLIEAERIQSIISSILNSHVLQLLVLEIRLKVRRYLLIQRRSKKVWFFGQEFFRTAQVRKVDYLKHTSNGGRKDEMQDKLARVATARAIDPYIIQMQLRTWGRDVCVLMHHRQIAAGQWSPLGLRILRR